MKAIPKLKFSIASVLVLTAIIGFATSVFVSRRAVITKDTQAFEALIESSIDITQTRPEPNFVEVILGVQLQPSEFRARLNSADQLYELTKLSNLKELDVSVDSNSSPLMMFSYFDKLETLRVYDWYGPKTMAGVQLLSNLKFLEIGGVEVPKNIDLSALADHPTLEVFRIGDFPLDKSKNFQVLPEF